jgi:hypothetical protein
MRWILPLLLTSCGIIAGDTGCDLRTESAVNGFEDRCQERTGFQGNAIFGGFCDVLGGDPLDGGCPDEGKVLGCDISAGVDAGGKVIDWYYEPVTREEVEADCADDDGEVVEP